MWTNLGGCSHHVHSESGLQRRSLQSFYDLLASVFSEEGLELIPYLNDTRFSAGSTAWLVVEGLGVGYWQLTGRSSQ